MTLSAWRPLKAAPKNLPAYVEDSNGTHVATWDDEWGYWLGERLCILSEDTLSLPIADTYELDRAVQGEIARAFGALIQAMVDGRECFERYSGEHAALMECEQLHQDAIRKVATILHTAMGGRIPGEVP